MSDVIAYPLVVQKLFRRFEGRRFFEMMDAHEIFCETQYMSLNDENKTMEQVYVLNTKYKASMAYAHQREAQGLILSTGGHVISRCIKATLPHDHDYAKRPDTKLMLRKEQIIQGDTIMIFYYGERMHIATPYAANGLSVCSWDRTLTHYEAVTNLLHERFSPWHLPFTRDGFENKYTWQFVLTPPTDVHEKGQLYLVAAFHKSLNTEIKPQYLNQFARAWGFKRPNHVSYAGEGQSVESFIQAHPVGFKRFYLMDPHGARVLIEDVTDAKIERLLRVPHVGLRSIVELVLRYGRNRTAELLPEEFTNIVYIVEDFIEECTENMERLWSALTEDEEYECRKHFAYRASAYTLAPFMFMAYDGKIKNAGDVLENMRIPWLMRELRLKRSKAIDRELQKINQLREDKRQHAEKESKTGRETQSVHNEEG